MLTNPYVCVIVAVPSEGEFTSGPGCTTSVATNRDLGSTLPTSCCDGGAEGGTPRSVLSAFPFDDRLTIRDVLDPVKLGDVDV